MGLTRTPARRLYLTACAAGLVAASLAGCSSATTVSTAGPVSAEQADASMKASALAGAAQVVGWIRMHNIGTSAASPSATPSASETGGAVSPSSSPSNPSGTQSSSPSPSGTQGSSSPSPAGESEAYASLPDTLDSAKPFMALLDTDDVLSDFVLTPNVVGTINPGSVTVCVAVTRLPSAVQGTQKTWVVWRSGDGRVSLLKPSVTSCTQAEASSTLVPSPATSDAPSPTTSPTSSAAATPSPTQSLSPQQQRLAADVADVTFGRWVTEIPDNKRTELGQAAATDPARVLAELAAGTKVSAVVATSAP